MVVAMSFTKESGNSLLWYFNYYIYNILTFTNEPLITCQLISESHNLFVSF